MKIRTYQELRTLTTFEDRLEYLRLKGSVGKDTFGFDRYFNQKFYKSKEWKQIRNHVIARDLGCDLGVDGYDILGERVLIHHMNPISLEDLEKHTDQLLNSNYLITVTHRTHNMIHYGIKDKRFPEQVERRPNDTCPWKT